MPVAAGMVLRKSPRKSESTAHAGHVEVESELETRCMPTLTRPASNRSLAYVPYRNIANVAIIMAIYWL